MLRDVQAFERRLSAAFPGAAWLRVFERHRDGALHVHVLVPPEVAGRGYAERRTRRLARLWGLGHVDADPRFGSGHGALRRAARYASKYVTKGAVAGLGRHSYEVRQGFQPEAARFGGPTVEAVWAELVRAMGGEVPAYESRSSEWSDYRGPPARVLAWSG